MTVCGINGHECNCAVARKGEDLVEFVCVCMCVFGTGEEEKEVNRDRGGTCQRHRASGQQTHTQALCMALQTMMPRH